MARATPDIEGGVRAGTERPVTPQRSRSVYTRQPRPTPAPMPHGLPRKIRIAFIVQMVMASPAILVAFYVVAALFKYSFIQATLQDEADHYWQLHEASAAQPPPNNYALRGYLVEAGYSNLSLPPHLRPLTPGFHDLGRRRRTGLGRPAIRPAPSIWCTCASRPRGWRCGSPCCRRC